jgi:NAD(P)-dependent dehydrogenase (short-subunit alcohol dehydrogenase family)/aryl carrier-like protein
VAVQLRSADGAWTFPKSSVVPTRRISTLSGDASYLLVGGLGGLGRSISIWMVEHGARHLVFMSRSAGRRAEDLEFVHELESMGCAVYLVPGDVVKVEDVQRAFDIAADAGPLKGIYQMSIVLRDETFGSMSWDQWNTAVSPKVKGTWRLHDETVARNLGLDFFVLFSSISGLIGQPGQANYASANTFLDAFVQYRNGLGLAASAVQLGPVEDTGVIARSAETLNQVRSSGFYLLRESEVLDATEVAISSNGENSFVLGMRSTLPLSSPNNRLVWRRDRRMAFFHISGLGMAGGGSAPSSDGLKAFLSRARADPSILATQEATQLLAVEIGRKVSALLLKPVDDEIDTSIGLVALGLDSLVGIEMRQWLKAKLGVDISVVQMLGMGTLEMLAKFAALRLAKVG